MKYNIYWRVKGDKPTHRKQCKTWEDVQNYVAKNLEARPNVLSITITKKGSNTVYRWINGVTTTWVRGSKRVPTVVSH